MSSRTDDLVPRFPRLLVGFGALALLLASGPISPAAAAHAALERPTELQYWDSTRAFDGYNFFGAGGKSYLLDMEGRVVHSWPIGTNPHLLSDGSVLDAANDDPSGFSGFKQVSWDGTTVWSYLDTRSTYHPHHDFARIWNAKLGKATTLYIANKDFTYAELVAAGADPIRTPSTGGQLDAIVEVDSSGTVVWEWCFLDHVVQDLDATKANYVGAGKTIADFPGRLDINLAGHTMKKDWLHCNALDYNPSLDQIVIDSVQGELYVIDHGNTFVAGSPAASIALAASSVGDFLYRFGDPARYGQGTKPRILEDWTLSTTGNKQLGGSHDVQWIAEGLPGAGHLLIFDNAQYLSEHTAQSYVMEIDPYLDATGSDTGHYVNPPDAGYVTVTSPAVTDKTPKLISKQVVWSYSSKSNLTIFSHIGCSAQRLPNGNTLICADTEGYILEVTPEGEAVWDYIVPLVKGAVLEAIGDDLPMTNSIFRAFRYAADHPALAGRTLTAGATIAGRTTVANPYAGTTGYAALQRPTETQYWDPANAFGGYTFFGTNGTSFLIDMAGKVVHTWPTGSDPRLLENGHLLDWITSSGTIVGLRELDWAGNVVWSFTESRSAYHPHGAFTRIFDAKLGASATLFLANRDVTEAECIAAGCDPADAPFDGAQVDTIVEIDSDGNVVWEWSFWDHAIQDVDATKANYVGTGKTIADYPGRIDLNLPGRPLGPNWLDGNAIDYDATKGRIVVGSRQGELYVIDHDGTFLAGDPAGSRALAASSAGDFLYRFGDPARYGQGNPPSVGTNWETATNGNKQIGGSSDVQWIASGLPGAGRLLVFDNNQYLYQRTPQSYVFEIDPFLTSSGTSSTSYVDPPSAGYGSWTFDKDTHKSPQQLSKQVVWKYGSVGNLTFFSHFGGSAQRLPNGNTLICSTTQGYLFEVDSSGNVVWEYISPVTASGVVSAIGDAWPMTNAVPRARRYAGSFAGFTGHDLTAGNTIAANPAPTISESGRTPLFPTAKEAVWITSRVGDDRAVRSVVLTYLVGASAASGVTVTMLDDGAHSDGAAGDGLYGAEIPAEPAGTTVSYHVTATDDFGRSSVIPTTAPSVPESYTVAEGACTGSNVYFVPAGAHAAGEKGAQWVTDLALQNAGEAAATVRLDLLERDLDNSSPSSVTISVALSEQLALPDLFLAKFGRDGVAAALRICSDQPLRVMSRTYNLSSTGTFGQGIPGYPVGSALGPDEAGQLIFLSEGTKFRTNIGFVNTEATTVSVEVELRDASGSLLGTKVYTLLPYEYVQRSKIFTEVTANEVAFGSAVVRPTGGHLFAYASLVDNATGDPTYIHAAR
jgi:hypothetical protein